MRVFSPWGAPSSEARSPKPASWIRQSGDGAPQPFFQQFYDITSLTPWGSAASGDKTMPLSPNDWKQAIRAVLTRISDAKYQRRAWFNKHHEISSPDE